MRVVGVRPIVRHLVVFLNPLLSRDHRNANSGCAGVVCGASTSRSGCPSPIANALRFRSSAARQVPRSVTVMLSSIGYSDDNIITSKAPNRSKVNPSIKVLTPSASDEYDATSPSWIAIVLSGVFGPKMVAKSSRCCPAPLVVVVVFSLL